jgi:glycosyltransferase involved in cell wall biosynthesis
MKKILQQSPAWQILRRTLTILQSMSQKLPISACMISGSEAHRIGKALDSVAGWTSEIIVVLNQEVADGTEQLAISRGAKVFREPWKGFVGQKNSAADKCSQPWILGLDADEAVSPSLREEIESALADSSRIAASSAFCFPRCTYYCGRWIRHGDWYPDRVTRLWKKNSCRWEGVEPHARLAISGKVSRLRNDLLHYSNESIDRQIGKIGPYSDYFVRHCLINGRAIGLLDLGVRPFWRFLRGYFFRLGFLDGWPGYYIAWLSAFSVLTRYAKVCEARLPKEPLDR